MTFSSYDWREEYNTTHAWGYNENNEPGTIDDLRTTANGNAANSLRTNVIDLSLFLDALMVGYGLSEKSFKEFTTGGWRMDEGWYSAPGIRVNYNEGTNFGPMLFHSGSNPNFRAMFWLFPEKQTYVAYFTNSENGTGPMRQAMYNIFFPQFPNVSY
jgi:CubicO group peptidase (beta-lactamase class C family)